jgi:hypothetical protein
MSEYCVNCAAMAEQIEKLRGRCERFCTICSGHYFSRDPGCPWCEIQRLETAVVRQQDKRIEASEQIAKLEAERDRQATVGGVGDA